MNFIIKENGTPQYIRNNENIAIGFYGEYGNKYVAKLLDRKENEGQITKDSSVTGKYTAFIPSEVTRNFSGNVDVEIVVFDRNSDQNVAHADNIIQMFFEDRRINDEL